MTEVSKATSLPPRKKSPLKSQTFSTLFRILSLSQLHPPHQLLDNGGFGAEKEVSRERVSELVGGDQNKGVAEKGLGDIENLQSGGFSDTQLVIDEIENMMRVEDDENEKRTMDECVEFRELQELLMDDLVHTVQGNGDNNCSNITTLLDENKSGGNDIVFTNRDKNFNPQPTDLKECNPLKQLQVNDKENFGQNSPANVLTSFNKDIISEGSTSIDKSRITGLAMDHDVQQSAIVAETSVCSSDALISRNYGIEDDEREEGEFSCGLEVEDRSAPTSTSSEDALLLKKRADGKEDSEENLDKSKMPLVEKDEVKSNESSAILFMKTFDKYNSGSQVEAKESDRDEMKHKRKLVVYEDPILGEEACQHKEKKKRCVTKKQKEVSGANEHKKLGGKVEQMKASVARNVVTCPVSSSSDLPLSSNSRDENAGTNPGTVSKDQDVVPCIKKKRGPLSEERKAKKKQQKRKKRAEKNRELGVKRLKLRPVVKPKPVTYCRHFLNGRCHEGEKCKFSHDTTPLTKSKPCCHFARHACMKGDDCPFDHQLSKYPCTNYVSKGHCSRGESCMFSHKLLPKEDVPETSNISTPVAKSQSLCGTSTSKKGEKTVAKSEANLLAVTPMAKGVRFLSSGKNPIADSSCSLLNSLSSKKNDVSKVENQKDQSASNSVQKLNEISKGITQSPSPKGINFLSFGKAPLASLTISSTQSSLTGILQENGIPRSSSSLKGSTDGFRSASVTQSSLGSDSNSVQVNTTPSDKQDNFHIIPKGLTTNPFGLGKSSDFLSHAFLKNASISSQKALMSTLAFAAKIEYGMKQNRPHGSSGSLTIDSAEASAK